VLWSEAAVDARPLPFASVFVPRFDEAREHWTPDGVGTDPEDMAVWTGAPGGLHSGDPIGTPEEFLSGLSYAKWLNGDYNGRTSEICHISISLPFDVRASLTLDAIEQSSATVADQVGLAARVDAIEQSSATVADQVGLAPRVDATETFTPAEDMTWTKTTIGFASVQTASTSNTLTVQTIASKQFVHAVVVSVTTNFAGTGILSLQIQPKYDTSNIGTFINGLTGTDGSQQCDQGATAESAMPSGTNLGLAGLMASKDVKLTFTSSGANLSALNAGSVDVYVLTSDLP